MVTLRSLSAFPLFLSPCLHFRIFREKWGGLICVWERCVTTSLLVGDGSKGVSNFKIIVLFLVLHTKGEDEDDNGLYEVAQHFQGDGECPSIVDLLPSSLPVPYQPLSKHFLAGQSCTLGSSFTTQLHVQFRDLASAYVGNSQWGPQPVQLANFLLWNDFLKVRTYVFILCQVHWVSLKSARGVPIVKF